MFPSLCRSFKVLLFLVFEDGESIWQLTVGQDIKSATHLLLSVFVGDAAEGHLIAAVLLGETLLTDLHFDLLADFISLLFVFVEEFHNPFSV